MKTLKNILRISIPSLIFIIFILELFFRFVIPASNPPLSIYNLQDSYIAYSNKVPSGQYTIGKFAQIRSQWTINNYGFNYPIDFKSPRDTNKPLIAIIGDSYIEAFQVDSDKNYPFLLRNKLYPNFEVYGFGFAGQPLSQYVHMNKVIKENFNPDIIVYQLVHNDFDESLKKYAPTPNFWTIEKKGTLYSWVPTAGEKISITSSGWKSFLYKSSLFRYLHRNLVISQSFNNKNNNAESNTIITESVEKQKEVKEGVGFLFGEIKKMNSGKRTIFIFDAPRSAIYNDSLDKSKVLWMYEMVSELCRAYNFELIDLTSPMHQDYIKNERKFNSEIDAHWNVYGHKFVADYFYNYLTAKK